MRNLSSARFYGIYADSDTDDPMLATIADKLPHGSGIDADWTIDRQENGKYVCCNSYHMMNEHGYYVGWQNFTVKLDSDGKLLDVQLNGGHSYQARQSMLLDYLNDTFAYIFQ